MKYTTMALVVTALMLGACSDDEHEINKSRPINSVPSTPSTVMESMGGKEQGDQATGAALETAKEAMEDNTDTAKEMTDDNMDKTAEAVDSMKEMAEDGAMMDKAEAMATDSGMMEKAETMMPKGSDMMDSAKGMMEDKAMMDKAESMVDSSAASGEMKEAMNNAHSMFGIDAGEDAATAVEEATEAMATVSMEDGTALAKKSGCFACHAIDRKVLGPAWKDVAAKYADDKVAAKARLLTKVAKGGKGVWADQGITAAMPPYSPRVSDENIETLVDFVLGL